MLTLVVMLTYVVGSVGCGQEGRGDGSDCGVDVGEFGSVDVGDVGSVEGGGNVYVGGSVGYGQDGRGDGNG